jgi:release factor glutamine methyltransferase
MLLEAALRRLKHEPIQYILGEWGFRDLTLKTHRPILIPRPETEELVDIALKL